jgi:tellurite resistance protein
MNGALLALMFSVGALAIGAGLMILRQHPWPAEERQKEKAGRPGFSDLNKEARANVIRDAVVLATELSRVDDFIAPTEVDSIRDFILAHVSPTQVAEITQAMRDGMGQPVSPTVVKDVCTRIREGYTLQHRELVAHFLVHVAHADGLLCPEEQAFLERVVPELGVQSGNLASMLSVYDEWVRAPISEAAS